MFPATRGGSDPVDGLGHLWVQVLNGLLGGRGVGRRAPAKGSGFPGCVLEVTPGPGSVLLPFCFS